jgi:hypothetical protein
MELLDRYLQAVRKHLRWQRQDDIIAELRANLESQLEDREAELGRPLTAAEAESWLRQIGPPEQMAARYEPPRSLIGPALFPTYWYVLRLASFWAAVASCVVSAVQIAAGTVTWDAAVQAALRVPGVVLMTAAWVTLVFAVLELAARRYPEKCPPLAGIPGAWNPANLPPANAGAGPGDKPRSYAHAVTEVVFGVLLLAWLLLIPKHPFLLLGPAVAYLQASPFELAPVWMQVYWWVVALNALQVAWRSLDLWRSDAARPRVVQHIAVKAVALIPLLLLLAVPDHAFVLLRHPALDQAQHGRTLDSLNLGMYRLLVFTIVISGLQLVWDIGKMSQSAYRKRAAAMR